MPTQTAMLPSVSAPYAVIQVSVVLNMFVGPHTPPVYLHSAHSNNHRSVTCPPALGMWLLIWEVLSLLWKQKRRFWTSQPRMNLFCAGLAADLPPLLIGCLGIVLRGGKPAHIPL